MYCLSSRVSLLIARCWQDWFPLRQEWDRSCHKSQALAQQSPEARSSIRVFHVDAGALALEPSVIASQSALAGTWLRSGTTRIRTVTHLCRWHHRQQLYIHSTAPALFTPLFLLMDLCVLIPLSYESRLNHNPARWLYFHWFNSSREFAKKQSHLKASAHELEARRVTIQLLSAAISPAGFILLPTEIWALEGLKAVMFTPTSLVQHENLSLNLIGILCQASGEASQSKTFVFCQRDWRPSESKLSQERELVNKWSVAKKNTVSVNRVFLPASICSNSLEKM